jgi:hypothetical protein
MGGAIASWDERAATCEHFRFHPSRSKNSSDFHIPSTCLNIRRSREPAIGVYLSKHPDILMASGRLLS